jgi:hypothetical protein
MERRTLILATSAVVIGLGVLLAQTTLVGLLAAQTGPTTPQDITRPELEWRGLWHSLLFTWSLPAALGALVIAYFKPRRWMLYSACAVAPDLIFNIQGVVWLQQHGMLTAYDLLSHLVHLVLIPLFLRIYYAMIRRHGAATA